MGVMGRRLQLKVMERINIESLNPTGILTPSVYKIQTSLSLMIHFSTLDDVSYPFQSKHFTCLEISWLQVPKLLTQLLFQWLKKKVAF